MASADELRAQYGARREQAMGRLMALGAARQRYMQEQQAKMEAKAKAEQAKLQAQQAEGSKNWLQMADKGAMMGTSVMPGWGTLIGAGVGAVAGIAGSAAQRHREGDGFWKSIGNATVHPVGDKFDGMSDIPIGGMTVGGIMGAKAAGVGQPGPTGPQPYQGAGTSGPLSNTDYLTDPSLGGDPSLAGSSGGYPMQKPQGFDENLFNKQYTSSVGLPKPSGSNF